MSWNISQKKLKIQKLELFKLVSTAECTEIELSLYSGKLHYIPRSEFSYNFL